MINKMSQFGIVFLRLIKAINKSLHSLIDAQAIPYKINQSISYQLRKSLR